MIGSQPLTRTQLRELEDELLRERARLERLIENQSPDSGGDGVAPPAPPAEEGGLALATRTHARYEAVLEALSRLAAGTYGVCTSCGGRIPYGRLLVMPEATRCVACGPRL